MLLCYVFLQGNQSNAFPGILTTLEYTFLRSDPSTAMIGYAGVTYKSPPDHPHGCDFGCGLLFWISFNLVKSNGSFAYINGSSPYLSHFNYGIASELSVAAPHLRLCSTSTLLGRLGV